MRKKVKYLFRKANVLFAIIFAGFVLSLPARVMAAESSPEYNIEVQEISADKEKGEYSFKICIDTAENYAGAEFGTICSQGVEINVIGSNAESMTGPKEANGLVWFGFFDGEDSFSEQMTVTVKGNYDPEIESAILIQDIKIYTVGDEEYTSKSLEAGMVVNLNANSVTENVGVPTGDNGINIVALTAIFMAILAVAVSILIYIKKMRGERKNAFKKISK